MSTSQLVAESVWKDIESTHSVTDDQLSILHFIFGKNFERATRIVDQSGVKRILAQPSGRCIFQNFQSSKCLECDYVMYYPLRDYSVSHIDYSWQWKKVVGESRKKEEYTCFAEHYCACYSFFYDVVNRGEQLCCKHQLAARLAAATGTCIDAKVSDEELALLLSNL